MKTVKEVRCAIMAEVWQIEGGGYEANRDKQDEVIKQYGRELLQDYDNWKAHKTPDLVKQYIKEKGL